MLDSKESSKSKIVHYIECIALLTAVVTPIFFVIGHLSAYFFFTSFEIQYFKYTDTFTAFSFALESIDVVLSVIALGLLFIFSFGYFNSSYRPYEHLKIKKIKFKYLLKASPKFMFLSVSGIFIFAFLLNVITSINYREEISNKKYVPYEVSFNQGKNTYKCVTSIGTLGQFQVFVTEFMQPILVQENQILYIKPLFAPVPLESLPAGKSSVKNPEYENEMKIWIKKWQSICKSKKVNNFEVFKFKQSGTPERPR
jgi:hypothetical protein